jgi:two-component system invasion response regulator UvrY
MSTLHCENMQLHGKASIATATSGLTAEPIRVLVAESNPHLRSLLGWVLTHDERFRVVAQVGDGDGAATCKEEFDVALVDLSISGLGGLGTIARLRQRRPAPAIVVLADTDAIYLRHAAAAEGAACYLVKPADLHSLADHLAEVAVTVDRRLVS